MKISGTNGINTQTGNLKMSGSTDSFTKNIQRQISNAQKQLQELSSNEEMSLEEKMNKRQEIQKQITDLNNQLRQHQIEQRKEQQQKKSSMEDLLGKNQQAVKNKNGSQGTGFSQESMKAIISGDAAMSQAKVQGSTAAKMEGRAGVLKAEIKQDAALGGNTQAKEEELAKTEQIAGQAAVSQMNTLGEANREIKEAAKSEKMDSEKEKKESAIRKGPDMQESSTPENTAADIEAADNYAPVDIRL